MRIGSSRKARLPGGAIWQKLAGKKPPFPVVALSEPERIRKALTHFA